MHFTLIIPAFNEEEDISYCLESCLSQSYQNFELIVVNDGSTDKTELIVNKFKKRAPEKSKL